MRLPKPFYRLPHRFDAARLRAEIEALPAHAWTPHPNGIPGNSAVRLITVDGADNDDVHGVMLPTPHLAALPYVRQVLASFGVAWSRSRLLRLAPGASVPQHSDINHHWFQRVRVHVPVVTTPHVRFHCGHASVHMAAGEAWVFDNWRPHRVTNDGPIARIHLVADTSGNSRFWNAVAASADGAATAAVLQYDPARDADVLTERALPAVAMPAAEVDHLVSDLRADLAIPDAGPEARRRLQDYDALLAGFCRDWRELHALHAPGEVPAPDVLEAFVELVERMRAASRTAGDGVVLASNRVAAHTVLEARVLRAAVDPRPRGAPGPVSTPRPLARVAAASPRTRGTRFERPVFLIAAPRSGSTLLFETLAASTQLCSIGGEAHAVFEGDPRLRPGAPGVTSNRLAARHATPDVAARIDAALRMQLVDETGHPLVDPGARRLLEKTPKNALRVPFLDALHPDACFVFLWRDPRENLASIMEAWRSGRWRTYNGLPGFDGPWSLLLPPGWELLNGRPLEEIAAFQWESANRIALDDLECLPPERWCALDYATLTAAPERSIRGACAKLGLAFDAGLAQRLAQPLPHSRYTQTPPDPDKWRRHEGEIARVLPTLEHTWRRLRALTMAAGADRGATGASAA